MIDPKTLENQRKRRQRAKEKGYCTICIKKPAAPGRCTCDQCLDHIRQVRLARKDKSQEQKKITNQNERTQQVGGLNEHQRQILDRLLAKEPMARVFYRQYLAGKISWNQFLHRIVIWVESRDMEINIPQSNYGMKIIV
jgi:hypothetical protein